LLAAQAVRGGFYGNTQSPASAWVGVERLAKPALLIEVDAVAICGQTQCSAEGYSSNWTNEGRIMAKQNQVFNIRAAEKAFAYSQAVRAGNLLFISGTVSWDADATPVAVGDMRAQLQNVYEELKRTLEAHGASFADVAKETVYTRDMDALIAAAPTRAAYFKDCAPPASTWVQVSRLVHADLLLEVEMTAVLS
jgi:2-iminobutanoate/2-iminopropanoate deaminase